VANTRNSEGEKSNKVMKGTSPDTPGVELIRVRVVFRIGQDHVIKPGLFESTRCPLADNPSSSGFRYAMLFDKASEFQSGEPKTLEDCNCKWAR